MGTVYDCLGAVDDCARAGLGTNSGTTFERRVKIDRNNLDTAGEAGPKYSDPLGTILAPHNQPVAA